MMNRLSPFLPLLTRVCSSSTSATVSGQALRCVPALLRLQLPSSAQVLPDLTTMTLSALSGVKGKALVAPALKTITAVLRHAGDTLELTQNQVDALLSFITEHVLGGTGVTMQIGALHLLRAIMSRSYSCTGVYDLATHVQSLLVSSPLESVQKTATSAFIAFLLSYPMSAKRRTQHLTFLLTNLRCFATPSGRSASAKALAAIAKRFPLDELEKHVGAFLLPLVDCLLNDNTSTCRLAAAEAIRALCRRCRKVMGFAEKWLEGTTTCCAAIQVLSLYVESVDSTQARGVILQVLPIIKQRLSVALDAVESLIFRDEPDLKALESHWPLVHHSLVFVARALPIVPSIATQLNSAGDGDGLLIRCALYPHAGVRAQALRVHACIRTESNDDDKSVSAWSDALVTVFRGLDVDSDTEFVELCVTQLTQIVDVLSQRNLTEPLGHVLRRMSMRLRRETDVFKKVRRW